MAVMKDRKFSRAAVNRAMNSEHANRLQEIALEHIKLAKEMALNRQTNSQDEQAAIESLRAERDDIIRQFKEEDNYGQ